MGIVGVPSYRMLWGCPQLWGCALTAQKMTCNRFEDVLFSLHFVNNSGYVGVPCKRKSVCLSVCHFANNSEDEDKEDKLWNPADEAIVAFKGRVGFKTNNPANEV